jgi:HD superfamily phosphohydrolase
MGTMVIKEKYGINPSDDLTILYFDNSKNNDKDETIYKYLDIFFKLYIIMYYKIYYGEQNKALQAMLTKALYLAYDLGEIDLEELPALTDVELLTLLENSLDARVRELAKCVRYGYAFKPLLRFNAENFVKTLQKSEKTVNDVEHELSQIVNKYRDDIINRLEGKFTGIEHIVIIDLQRKKKICDFVYIKEKDGSFKKYEVSFLKEIADEETEETFEDWVNELIKWRGFVFVHPSIVYSDKRVEILDAIKKELEKWGVNNDHIYKEYL